MPDGFDVTAPAAPRRTAALRVSRRSAALALTAALSGCGAGLVHKSPPAAGPGTSPGPSVSRTVPPQVPSPAPSAPRLPLRSPSPTDIPTLAPATRGTLTPAQTQSLSLTNSLPPFVFRGATYSVSAGALRDRPNQGVVVIARSPANGQPAAVQIFLDTASQPHVSERGTITLRSQDGQGNVIFGTTSGDVGALSVATGLFSPAG